MYYATHFEKISTFVSELDSEDAQSIANAQVVIAKPDIKKDLAFIKSNFECLSTTIIRIQAKGALLSDAIDTFDSVRPKLQALTKRQEFITKFNQVENNWIGYFAQNRAGVEW